MSNTILVPTDFSKHAAYAAEVAAQIAKRTGAEVVLLHVINLPNYEENAFSNYEEEGTHESMMLMQVVKKKFKTLRSLKFWEGVKVHEVVKFGAVHDAVVKENRERAVRLVVAGAHGMSGSHSDVAGSTIEKLVRVCVVPVLTIKKRYENFKLENIVFSSTFFGENHKPLQVVKEMANRNGSNLHLLKVITPDNFEPTSLSRKLIYDMAEKNGIENFTAFTINDFHIESGIYAYAKHINADLVCLATHGRTGWARLFGKSVAEEVSSHADIPILSIRLTEVQEKTGVIFPE